MSWIAFIVSAFAVIGLTVVVRAYALRRQIVDVPNEPRKIHARPTPLLGGVAIFLGALAVIWYIAFFAPHLFAESVRLKYLIGISLGGLVLIIGGYFDDARNLAPSRQIIFPMLAALIVIASGIGIRAITNPFGGTQSLVLWERVLFWWQGVGYRITLPADLFSFVWLMGLMYTTKVLDGLDGLVSGIAVVGALMVYLLSMTVRFFQPEVGLLALIIGGAFAGFLFWNWHPAKIFLGTGGSTMAGFFLGILAIISGSKVMTTLLVVGIPVLDFFWVIFRRAVWERKNPARADRKHLHFRLLDAGLPHRAVVLLYLGFALLFGMTTLFFQAKEKLITFGLMAVFMVGVAAWVVYYKVNTKRPRTRTSSVRGRHEI